MRSKELRNRVRNEIETGNSPQDVYGRLEEAGNMADENLADLVRYVPTLERRQRYKAQHYALAVLMLLVIAWKLAVDVPAALEEDGITMVFKMIWAMAWAAALVGVWKYWRRFHAFAGLIGFLTVMRQGQFANLGIGEVAFMALVGGVAILGFHLQRKLTPDYIVLKERYTNAEGQERVRQVVRFGD